MPLPRLFGYRTTCDRMHRGRACADPRCYVRASIIRDVRINQLLSAVADSQKTAIDVLSRMPAGQMRGIAEIFERLEREG